MFAHTASDQLVIPDHLVHGERNILLRLKCDDLIDLFRIERRQFDKARKNRLRRDRIIHVGTVNVHFVHYFAQHTSGFVQRSMGVTAFASCRVKRRFAETIIQQRQATVDYSKFRQTDGLGPDVESNETRRCGHGLKV